MFIKLTDSSREVPGDPIWVNSSLIVAMIRSKDYTVIDILKPVITLFVAETPEVILARIEGLKDLPPS